MSQNSKSKRLWECSEPMTHGILTLLILTWRDNDESIKKCCFSSACPRVQFQRYANAPFKSNVDRLIFFGELLSDLIEKLPLATSFLVLWVFSICSYLIFEEFVPWFLQSKLRQLSQKCHNFSVACWFLWGYLILIKTFSLFAWQLFCSFSFWAFSCAVRSPCASSGWRQNWMF